MEAPRGQLFINNEVSETEASGLGFDELIDTTSST